SAATSLKPESVIEAVREYYEKYSLNSHSGGGGFLSQKVRQNISQTRQLIAQKIKAKRDEIFFLPSTTYALNILALSARDFLAPGDKISLTRLEHIGTLPLAQIFGLKAAFEFLNSLDIKEINNYERELKNYALGKLKELEKVIIYNQELETVDIILFNLIGHHAHDVENYLGKNNILVRADNFCCPYLSELIGEEAAVRISLFIYNTKEEIDKLVCCLKELVENPDLIINVLDFSQ
ncbi:26510_t:CDS:2, partial [Racocetra persica]